MFVDVVNFVYRSRESLSHIKSILQFLWQFTAILKKYYIKKYFNIKDYYAKNI